MPHKLRFFVVGFYLVLPALMTFCNNLLKMFWSKKLYFMENAGKIKHFCGSFITTLYIFAAVSTNAHCLTIKENPHEQSNIFYSGAPVFAFGPSPQNILTFLPEGLGNDYKDWTEWAGEHNYRNVRSFPPSIIVQPPATNIFLNTESSKNKYDLNLFNAKYFEELRKACLGFKDKGIIVHLQLWQAVYWKKFWNRSYYNPQNNINPDISKHAGPGEFVTMKSPALLEHQKKYVKKILDATGDLGNVFYDIMNEIGNGTGRSEAWVWEIIKTINEWEDENGIDVLITLNDEGGRRMGNFSLKCPGLDLIIKDLGTYEEHIEARKKYKKPTVSVRNIDYDYEKKTRFWFFGDNNLEVNTNPELQTRGRKYWWRMFMAGVQVAGGYADSRTIKDYKWIGNKITRKIGLNQFFDTRHEATYRLNMESEKNFSKFTRFISQVKDYETLKAVSGVLADHDAKNSYALQDKKQVIIYIESPNGKAGYIYNESQGTLRNLILNDGIYEGQFYHPENGQTENFTISLAGGVGKIQMPAFKDDLAIVIN